MVQTKHQDELLLDAGSKTDATAAETETAVPEQNTGEKGGCKMSTKGPDHRFFFCRLQL